MADIPTLSTVDSTGIEHQIRHLNSPGTRQTWCALRLADLEQVDRPGKRPCRNCQAERRNAAVAATELARARPMLSRVA